LELGCVFVVFIQHTGIVL